MGYLDNNMITYKKITEAMALEANKVEAENFFIQADDFLENEMSTTTEQLDELTIRQAKKTEVANGKSRRGRRNGMAALILAIPGLFGACATDDNKAQLACLVISAILVYKGLDLYIKGSKAKSDFDQETELEMKLLNRKAHIKAAKDNLAFLVSLHSGQKAFAGNEGFKPSTQETIYKMRLKQQKPLSNMAAQSTETTTKQIKDVFRQENSKALKEYMRNKEMTRAMLKEISVGYPDKAKQLFAGLSKLAT